MAFEYGDLPVMGFAKVQDIPLWTTGTQYVLVDTGYKVTAEVEMLIGRFVQRWAKESSSICVSKIKTNIA